ncbi:uncharacterized protein LAESUDRAFT_616336, partial [Laetiporus sulphureus 93-53]
SALIFFEYTVTFSEEVDVIWGARLTTFTVIFALNRYLLMAQALIFALHPTSWHTPLVSHAVCEAVNLLEGVMTVALEAVIASFSAFRTYAINGHQIVPALLVLLLGLAPVGVNIVTIALTRTISAVILISGICWAVSELIVVLVTWFKISRLAIDVRKLRLRGSIATVLMRDGEYVWLSW